MFKRRWWRAVPPRRSLGPLGMQFVITSMPVGGAETLLVNLLRRIDPQIIRPEVICLKDPGPLGKTIANEFPVHSNLIRNKWDIGVVARLSKLMRERKTDVVITVGAGDKMFWGRLAAFLAGVPVIASALHSTGWPDGVGRLNRLLTPITDAFIAVASSHGRFLHDFERFPREKIHVIRNGVDCERFHPQPSSAADVRRELGIPEDGVLAGIVAALRPEKNHELLVKSAAKLRQAYPQLHWLIIGDGPERSRIEQSCRVHNVEDRIHLLGTRHDTPRLLSALDVFTLCSLNEASPVSILEALACEVPVVATNVGSVAETIIEGETGCLFESADLDGMVNAMSRLLDHPLARRQFGVAGRKRVLQSGSLDSMVIGYQNLATKLYDAASLSFAGAPAQASVHRAPEKV